MLNILLKRKRYTLDCGVLKRLWPVDRKGDAFCQLLIDKLQTQNTLITDWRVRDRDVILTLKSALLSIVLLASLLMW